LKNALFQKKITDFFASKRVQVGAQV